MNSNLMTLENKVLIENFSFALGKKFFSSLKLIKKNAIKVTKISLNVY
jgi:hypothetical protein